jgi:hypothetical protein
MTAQTITQAFADAAARLVGGSDISGNLVGLLTDFVGLVDAHSAGLLIKTADDSLALLSSTSHTATVLELYELQIGHGPCVEAVRSNAVISATAPDLAEQWDPVGRAIVDSGWHGVYAFPLRFNRESVGALNVFFTAARWLDSDQELLGQAFADMSVAVLTRSGPADWAAMHEQIMAILNERSTIELAKGVLAVQHDTDLADAYTLLVSMAVQNQTSLTNYANQVLDTVHRDRGPATPTTKG